MQRVFIDRRAYIRNAFHSGGRQHRLAIVIASGHEHSGNNIMTRRSDGWLILRLQFCQRCDEDQDLSTYANLVSSLKNMVLFQKGIVDTRAIAAATLAHRPLPSRGTEDLTVKSTAQTGAHH